MSIKMRLERRIEQLSNPPFGTSIEMDRERIDAEALLQLIRAAERWANDEADHEEPFDREGAFWAALTTVTKESPDDRP